MFSTRIIHSFLKKKVSPEDIGVVTPYRKQADKIKENLAGKGLGIAVGTVEEFQGDERKIIIVTTVQTNLNARGRKQGSIFWANSFFASQRHTNVALSRAQEFLIIVGDPQLMVEDKNWMRVLYYAHHRGVHYRDSGGIFQAPWAAKTTNE